MGKSMFVGIVVAVVGAVMIGIGHTDPMPHVLGDWGPMLKNVALTVGGVLEGIVGKSAVDALRVRKSSAASVTALVLCCLLLPGCPSYRQVPTTKAKLAKVVEDACELDTAALAFQQAWQAGCAVWDDPEDRDRCEQRAIAYGNGAQLAAMACGAYAVQHYEAVTSGGE